MKWHSNVTVIWIIFSWVEKKPCHYYSHVFVLFFACIDGHAKQGFEVNAVHFFFNNLIPLILSDNPIRLPAKTWSSFCIHISYYHFLFCFLRYNLHYVVYAEIGTVCTLITFMIHFSVDETLPARGQCLTLARNQRSQHQPHIPQSDSTASPPQHGSLPSLFLLLHSAVTLQKASLWVFPVVFW